MERMRIKTSRTSFIGNYILGFMVLVFTLLLNRILALPTLILYGLIVVGLMLFVEPESVIIYRTYFLDSDSVVEVKGILKKTHTAIPYKNIADRRLEKGVMGRILNYGDVMVRGFKESIEMKGVKNPERIYKEIEKRLTKHPPNE